MCIQHFNSIIGGAQSMKESPGSRVLHQIFPGCHIRINMVRPSVKLRRGFARSFHGGWFLASLGFLLMLSTNQFCFNFLHTLIIWYCCFVCAKLFASHYSGVCWFNPLVSTSSSTTTTCFTFVPGVLYFCAGARGFVYGNETGRGECGLIMEDSSAGAAFILVARMLSM